MLSQEFQLRGKYLSRFYKSSLPRFLERKRAEFEAEPQIHLIPQHVAHGDFFAVHESGGRHSALAFAFYGNGRLTGENAGIERERRIKILGNTDSDRI